MPLSEEELRLLEQMERALAAEDPKFVSTLQGRTLRRVARMRIVAASVVFLGGLAMLMGGTVTALWWLGALGFLVMLASATVGLAAWRGHRVADDRRAAAPAGAFDHDEQPHRFEVLDGGRARKPRRSRVRKQGTFMQRLEQRWQHRREHGGF